MKTLVSFLALCLTVLVSGGGTDAEELCASCDKQLQLTSDEWQCLFTSIDRYLTVKTDPVLVPFVQCEDPAALQKDATRSDPKIAPEASPQGTSHYRRALRLSKTQLACLKSVLPNMTAHPPSIFDFTKDCPQPAGSPKG